MTERSGGLLGAALTLIHTGQAPTQLRRPGRRCVGAACAVPSAVAEPEGAAVSPLYLGWPTGAKIRDIFAGGPLGVPAGPGAYLSGALAASAVAAGYAARARRLLRPARS